MEQKEENGEGNVEAAATRMQADAAIGAGSEPKPSTSARHGRQRQRKSGSRSQWPQIRQKETSAASAASKHGRSRHRLTSCYRDAHRPRWRYSTTRAPEGSTRATACPSAQRSTPQRTPLVYLVLTYLTHTLPPVLIASYNAVPHPRPHHPKPLLFAGI